MPRAKSLACSGLHYRAAHRLAQPGSAWRGLGRLAGGANAARVRGKCGAGGAGRRPRRRHYTHSAALARLDGYNLAGGEAGDWDQLFSAYPRRKEGRFKGNVFM